MKIDLDKTDLKFLDMLLRDVQFSPITREGLGLKPYAYYLQMKLLNKSVKSPIKEYDKIKTKYIKKRILEGNVFTYQPLDFEEVVYLIRKKLTKFELKNRNWKNENTATNI